MDYSLDFGSNITSLGFAFLFLKYLLPVILFFVAVGLIIFVISRILNTQIDFNLNTLENPSFWIFAVVVLLLVIALGAK